MICKVNVDHIIYFLFHIACVRASFFEGEAMENTRVKEPTCTFRFYAIAHLEAIAPFPA
jgi:hypothetical protein